MPPARKAGPVKKYSFRQRERETLPRSEQIRVSPLEKKRQEMERLEIPSYIISLIDRFIIDVRSILDFHFTFFFSFSFFSFTLTRTAANYPSILGSTMKQRQCEYRCYHVAIIYRSIYRSTLPTLPTRVYGASDGNNDCSRKKIENIFIL